MNQQTSPTVTGVPPAFLNRFSHSIIGVLSGFDPSIPIYKFIQSGPIRGKSGGFRFGCRRDFVVHLET